MFTTEQIQAAHVKVKSGADFPAYVQELIRLGVKSYDLFVADGHAEYFGEKGYKTVSAANYTALTIAESSNKEAFKQKLKSHQQGENRLHDFLPRRSRLGCGKVDGRYAGNDLRLLQQSRQ